MDDLDLDAGDRAARADIEAVRSARPSFEDGEGMADWRPRGKAFDGSGLIVVVIGGVFVFVGLVLLICVVVKS